MLAKIIKTIELNESEAKAAIANAVNINYGDSKVKMDFMPNKNEIIVQVASKPLMENIYNEQTFNELKTRSVRDFLRNDFNRCGLDVEVILEGYKGNANGYQTAFTVKYRTKD